MATPQQLSKTRHRQILDDGTLPVRRDRRSSHDGLPAQQDAQDDAWVKNFIARLAGLVGKTGGGN
jgi:hypothetical protein